MISRNILTDFLFIGIFVVVQVFLLNRLVIFDRYVPVLFSAYVMFYPFNRDEYHFLGTSFLLGLGVDIFLGTWGINACATTFIAFIRTLLFRTSTDSNSDFFSFETMPWTQFLGFIFLNVLVHQFLVQSIEYFKLSRILELLIDIIATTIYSYIFILFYILIFKIKQKI